MVDGWCCCCYCLFSTHIHSFILRGVHCIQFTLNPGYMKQISHLATSIASTVDRIHAHNGIMYLIRSAMLNEAKNTYYTKRRREKKTGNSIKFNGWNALSDWMPWHSCFVLLYEEIIAQNFLFEFRLVSVHASKSSKWTIESNNKWLCKWVSHISK